MYSIRENLNTGKSNHNKVIYSEMFNVYDKRGILYVRKKTIYYI